jgi:hypothetical protein
MAFVTMLDQQRADLLLEELQLTAVRLGRRSRRPDQYPDADRRNPARHPLDPRIEFGLCDGIIDGLAAPTTLRLGKSTFPTRRIRTPDRTCSRPRDPPQIASPQLRFAGPGILLAAAAIGPGVLLLTPRDRQKDPVATD